MGGGSAGVRRHIYDLVPLEMLASLSTKRAISMDTLLDVNDLTVEEVTGRHYVTSSQPKKNTTSARRLLLTEEKLLE